MVIIPAGEMIFPSWRIALFLFISLPLFLSSSLPLLLSSSLPLFLSSSLPLSLPSSLPLFLSSSLPLFLSSSDRHVLRRSYGCNADVIRNVYDLRLRMRGCGGCVPAAVVVRCVLTQRSYAAVLTQRSYVHVLRKCFGIFLDTHGDTESHTGRSYAD